MKPEQQYSSKGAIPKKTIHTLKQSSTSKEGLQSKIDPVKVTPSQVTTDMSGKSLTECASGTPQQIPQTCVLLRNKDIIWA